MKYIKPFLGNLILENLKTDVENILLDVRDAGSQISIVEGWSSPQFKPDIHHAYEGNGGEDRDHYNDEDDEDYDEDNEDEDYDEDGYDATHCYLTSLPKKGFTKTFVVNIKTRKSSSDQISQIIEELQAAMDRLNDLGEAWISYTIINNSVKIKIWVKTREMSDVNYYQKIELFLKSK